MILDWQVAVAVTVVLAAIGYLVRSAWQVLARQKTPGCGTCSRCPASAETQASLPLVSSDQLSRSADQQAAKSA